MKILLTFLFAFFTITISGQSRTPSNEEKQAINPIIDEGFKNWSESWSYDTYIVRSAKINSITVDEDYGDIKVYGTFSYKRVFQNFSGTFSAKLTSSGKLVSISYTDANGLRDTKSF